MYNKICTIFVCLREFLKKKNQMKNVMKMKNEKSNGLYKKT
jgi:hypothetical protein